MLNSFRSNLKDSGGMNGDKPEGNLPSEAVSGRESSPQREGSATVDLWRRDDGGRVTGGDRRGDRHYCCSFDVVCVSWDGVSDTIQHRDRVSTSFS